MGYKPPYEINDEMLSKVATISEKLGKLQGYKNLESRPHLRKINRIKSVHASLRIEANSLSVKNVMDVIDGKRVIGSSDEIKEVKNAYEAYERLKELNPYSIKDLLAVHAVMEDGLEKENGKFRSGEEGVFSGDTCIFVAPPPNRVPELMEELFSWMEENRVKIHPLILSSVFHYEFVFIHPFVDGNGRTARLWHTLLLYNWKNIFEFIPLESCIEKYQDEYYEAISTCHKEGNSNKFIEFMLKCTDEVLDELNRDLNGVYSESSEYVKKLINVMDYDIPYTTETLMAKLNLKSRASFMSHYVKPAIESGYINMTIPDKVRSKNQRYIRK